eukprot:CAMPEP_0113914472 /NCGR_PEP_ID=MMETSP0780_2-20120614/30378_1 /TAXON_ID=652834 /ORGANISM="Palpitomonas bilix" /LENGTH=483 /DNA_ID=CAMNT_0000912299 /DNA_START=125 /DNA_END=1572 /DNA_ORIENTATION=- /assembly_acc=CAM_ASM_000599
MPPARDASPAEGKRQDAVRRNLLWAFFFVILFFSVWNVAVINFSLANKDTSQPVLRRPCRAMDEADDPGLGGGEGTSILSTPAAFLDLAKQAAARKREDGWEATLQQAARILGVDGKGEEHAGHAHSHEHEHSYADQVIKDAATYAGGNLVAWKVWGGIAIFVLTAFFALLPAIMKKMRRAAKPSPPRQHRHSRTESGSVGGGGGFDQEAHDIIAHLQPGEEQREEEEREGSGSEEGGDGPGWLRFANAFSGGVFLSAAFCHLLPEVAEWKCCGGLSIGLTVSGIGFFLLLALDSLSHSFSLGGGGGAGHSHSHGIGFSGSNSSGSSGMMRKVMLLLVLCFHSVLAGMAMGVQTSKVKVVSIFVAIIAHKWVEAFAAGVQLVRSNSTVAGAVKGALAFSVMTPFGIATGALVFGGNGGGGHGSESNFTLVLEALSAGTFLYIGAIESLLREFERVGTVEAGEGERDRAQSVPAASVPLHAVGL